MYLVLVKKNWNAWKVSLFSSLSDLISSDLPSLMKLQNSMDQQNPSTEREANLHLHVLFLHIQVYYISSVSITSNAKESIYYN